MGYLDAFLQGLTALGDVNTLLCVVLGALAGVAVGLLPGIGAPVGIALLLPVTYSMEPLSAFALLIGIAGVAGGTGDLTSILLGVPGEVTSAAVVQDGHALTKKGLASWAVGASLMSSLMGGLIGAIVVFALLPVVQPLVLQFGSPEFFMLTVLGMAFIGVLSAQSISGGLVVASLGLLLATVGLDPQGGVARFTFGSLQLSDGLGLVPVALGLFGIPELYDLAKTKVMSAELRAVVGGRRQALQGMAEAWRHRWLVVRCSAIGNFFGILPGLGGVVSQWVAYGHAAQSSKNPEFGKGAIEAVIGVGAAANSKDSGALVPLVAFGIPGSVTTAVLLGALLIQGVIPGPSMLSDQLPLTMSLIWMIVLANVVGFVICVAAMRWLIRITSVRSAILIPLVAVLVFQAAYSWTGSYVDVGVMLAFGVVGCVMAALDLPRAPLLLGLVLGQLSERYLFRSVERYGYEWVGKPSVLILLALALAVIAPVVRNRIRARRQARELVPATAAATLVPAGDSLPETVAAAPEALEERDREDRLAGELLFDLVVLAVATGGALMTLQWQHSTRLFPLCAALATVAVLCIRMGVLVREGAAGHLAERMSSLATRRPDASRGLADRPTGVLTAWLVAFALSTYLTGLLPAALVGTVVYMRLVGGERWRSVLTTTIGLALVLVALDRTNILAMPVGVLLG